MILVFFVVELKSRSDIYLCHVDYVIKLLVVGVGIVVALDLFTLILYSKYYLFGSATRPLLSRPDAKLT